jgi:predicted dienelactone hydrolase
MCTFMQLRNNPFPLSFPIRFRLAAVLAAMCLVYWVEGAAAGHEMARLAGLEVYVWSPDTASTARLPVILFSHGFHGCATQSRFLMEAFADAGFIVFAPNHRDATCAGGGTRWTERSAVPFKDGAAWTDSSYADRSEDVQRLVRAIGTDARYGQRADLARIGLVGHSLGGYTVLGLAGAWPAWRMPHLAAVLALSPYMQPFLAHHTLGGVELPTMLQGGTLDFGVTPTLHKSMGAYDQLSAPKYYIEFKGASHFAWTNLGRTARASIVAYSVAFMNRYVKGDTGADVALREQRADVAVLRIEP